MTETKKKKLFIEKVNWISIVIILISWFLFSFIGMALPNMIVRLNNNNLTYGIWASYCISIGLFYIFNIDRKVTK